MCLEQGCGAELVIPLDSISFYVPALEYSELPTRCVASSESRGEYFGLYVPFGSYVPYIARGVRLDRLGY